MRRADVRQQLTVTVTLTLTLNLTLTLTLTRCANNYHQQCCNPPVPSVPEGAWLCPTCVANGNVVDPQARSCSAPRTAFGLGHCNAPRTALGLGRLQCAAFV